MKPNRLSLNQLRSIVNVVLISLFLISSFTLNAQTPASFAGKWVFDKAKSDKHETGDASFNGTIVLEITQSNLLITFAGTYFIPGRDGVVMPADSFFLDGRVTTDNGGTGPARKSAKWSTDKKSLTTSSIMNDSIDGVAQDFLSAFTYKLSDDGKTLFMEEFYKSKLNGEQRIKKVYQKKV